MKQYNELTYEEKVGLLQDALNKWKDHDKEYEPFDNKYTVGGWCLHEYYNKSKNHEWYEYETPPAEFQQDFYSIITTLDE